MSVRVTFSDECNADFRRLRGRVGRSVCEAVARFAQDGSGEIEVRGGFVIVHGLDGFATAEVRPDELYVHGIVSRIPGEPEPLLDEPEPPPED